MRLRYSLGLLMTALWAMPLSAQGTTGTIQGHVTNGASSRPIQGVTVSIAGRSGQSRSDGFYSISGVPAGTDSVRARMIGFAPFAQAVTLAPGETIEVDLALAERAVNLSEMVVVGYGEQAAGNITGAVTAVSSEDFNTGRVVTPSELIQNKVAGVQVIENNEPGGGTSIRIRGTTSTTASNDPLYVVDGVPAGDRGRHFRRSRSP